MWSLLGNVAVIAGLLGVSATNFVDGSDKGYWALAAVVATCVFVCFQAYRATKASLERRYSNGYLPIASFMRYTTANGTDYVYELFRHIQIKKPFMRSFAHSFTWSGTNLPLIKSDLQSPGVAKERKNLDGSTGTTVPLKFDVTKIYNDSEIVHLTMDIDDADQCSSPHLSQVVTAPIRLLSYRVELLHAPQSYCRQVAKFSRRPSNQAGAADEHLLNINFDPITKSYSHQAQNPEPGYVYKLAWERPPLPRKRGSKS